MCSGKCPRRTTIEGFRSRRGTSKTFGRRLVYRVRIKQSHGLPISFRTIWRITTTRFDIQSSFSKAPCSTEISSTKSSRTAHLDATIDKSDYWQESEITGHTVGLDDFEDDLEGLNGIGFRPSLSSPCKGYETKKQILDYKNREAKEARQQRSERRRRTDEVSVEMERAPKVRFAVENI